MARVVADVYFGFLGGSTQRHLGEPLETSSLMLLELSNESFHIEAYSLFLVSE